MRFTVILLFIVITGVKSARAQVRRSLAPQIAKVTRIIDALKKNNGDPARIAFYESILSKMKFTQAYLDKADTSKLKKPIKVAGSTWSGTLSLETITNQNNGVIVGQSVKKVQVSFIGAQPTMNREDDDPDLNFTDNKGTGSHYSHDDFTQVLVKRKCVADCSGTGEAELHTVIIREWDNTYDIEAIGPSCHGTGNCTEPWDEDKPTITVSNQPLTNKNVLEGSRTVTGELPAKLGTATTTVTWHLERDVAKDVLIVTPENYNTWLPRPGKDENDPGELMVIRLKVIGKNGQAPTLKVDHFELKLLNTSKEPGICLNMPLKVGTILPDIRFDDLANENTSPDGQTATALSFDGVTGDAVVNSYDGGGYTTFSVVAIMEDSSKLQGHLLVPGGQSAIPIPNRPPGSNIGEAWLAANKNPKDADDLETSPGNNNNGDGLSAYEEYRGVVAQGKFRRLDPEHKEVGVWVKRGELSLFKEGIGWFKRATFIDTVVFTDNEIGTDRKLNNNSVTARLDTQYVLKLEKGKIGGDVIGENRPITVLAKTPSASQLVIIDLETIKQIYTDQLNMLAANNRQGGHQLTMPYTLAESIANTVAHEMGHGVGLDHHGPPSVIQNITVPKGDPYYHVYDSFGGEIPDHDKPFPIQGLVGIPGNDESGDLNCIMAYTSQYQWVRIMNNTINYYAVGLLPVGKGLCTSIAGTGLNKKNGSGNNNYFGDAVNGNCLSQIKLK